MSGPPGRGADEAAGRATRGEDAVDGAPRPGCSLMILVARTDVKFLRHTVPHLSRQCGDACDERVLLMDTAAPSGFYRRQSGSGDPLEALRALCEELRRDGWIDRIVPIDYGDWETRRAVAHKHFGRRRLPHTHDLRGYPVFGNAYGLQAARFEHVVRFDSDLLVHQAPGHSWIREGMELLAREDDVMFVLPRSGPPRADGKLVGQSHPHRLDTRGFYRFDNFTSRLFLLDRRKFERLLPLSPARRGGLRQRLSRALRRASSLDSWERMVTARMEGTPYCRADLASGDAWSLHPPDKGERFLHNLPELIEKVESGWFPEVQAGHYDLELEAYV